MDLFFTKGYHATSIEDVARLAEISKGLLYHYFKGKEDVLAALVDVRLNDLLVVMNAAVAKSTPAEQIRHIAEGALDDVRRQPEVFRFYLNLFRGRQAPPKPDIKRVRPGKPPRQIPSFLTMKQAGEQDG